MLLVVASLALAGVASAAYPSQFLNHLEPVSNFEILHPRRNQLLSVDSGEAMPESLKVRFKIFDVMVDREIYLTDSVWAKDAIISIQDANGELRREIPQNRYYASRDGDGRLRAHVNSDGTITATLHHVNETGGIEVYRVDPLRLHEQEVHQHVLQSLRPKARHGMVAYRMSDYKHEGHLCGAAEPSPLDSDGGRRVLNMSDIHFHQRRLMAATDAGDPARWTNCYPNDVQARKIQTGVVCDVGFYKVLGSSTVAVQDYVASVYADSNTIYLPQMNVWIEVAEVIIKTTSGGETWNMDPASGSVLSINSALDALTAWRTSTKPNAWGLWHLLTNSYPPPGTVGLAWISVLCSKTQAGGVSTFSSTTWQTVAHEVGHNFAARHSFENGQGTTGGIMDYGDGLLNGIYQFESTYRKTEVCAHIAASMNGGSTRVANCWANYAPVCGNGVVEAGEDCDQGASNGAAPACCSSACKLNAGAQCTGGECCSNCKWLPTTTFCSGGSGYCYNGACKGSFCGTYGLVFSGCGMVTTNPCRQRCMYNNACNDMSGFSSGGQPLDNKAPDGALCRSSPYSTCSAGTCVAQTTVTYSWSTGNFGACSVTCGTGTQTRTVTCQDNGGNTVADSNCASAGTKPATSQSCQQPACLAYLWTQNVPWGTCSTTCGGGTQTRASTCYEQANPTVLVSNTLCSAATEPAKSQACNAQACPTAWVQGGFGACSLPCGSGTQTQSVVCKQTKDGVQTTVADASCSGAKPATSQNCNTQACAAYEWYTSTWSTCSLTCGSGTQTRTVKCREVTSQTDQTDSMCPSATKPIAAQSCNTQGCPTYAWETDAAWATCSVSCGGGTQTRGVRCIQSVPDGASYIKSTVADNFCTTAKPSGIQNCNTQLCPDYQWQTAAWGACNKACGGGTRTRNVFCQDRAQGDTSAAVANNLCPAASMPNATSSCNEQACPTYNWLIGDWSACPFACADGSQQTRTVECRLSGSTTASADSFCTATVQKPATSQLCPGIACAGNVWETGTWSACSGTCGGGTRVRTVRCVDHNNQPKLDTDCTATKPATTENCAISGCAVYWWAGEWGDCSRTCNFGEMRRAVECRLVGINGQIAPDAAMCQAAKPATTSTCNAFPCPQWVPQPWEACSARCGDGTRTRTILCVDNAGNQVNKVQCTASLPTSSEPCTNGPCPQWSPSAWSDCSMACGGGTQTRTLACRLPLDPPWFGRLATDASLCPEASKPAESQSCNIDACATYYWNVGAYGACSKPCATGTQTATVRCMTGSGASATVATDASRCFATQPTGCTAGTCTRDCNTQVCPIYAWQIAAGTDGQWTTCNADCGGGTQKRVVTCVDTAAGNAVVEDAKCASVPNMPAAEQPCNTQEAICNNGRCKALSTGGDGKCGCREGYTGQFCAAAPTITNVQTDASNYPNGVPVGNVLTITWTASPAISYVSLMLVRPTSPFPRYIAQQFASPGAGTFLWSIPTDLEPASDYQVKVWFSSTVTATSPAFTIGNLCNYVNCGDHGTCDPASPSSPCVCAGGWSGRTCAISPCGAARCNPLGSKCADNAADAIVKGITPIGECVCLTGFTGGRCFTPTGCTIDCKNGGTPFAAGSAGGCSLVRCDCPYFWEGNDCGSCGLKCKNNGKPDSNCAKCICPLGYMGSDCGCRHMILSVKLNLDNSWVAANNANRLAAFKTSFETELAGSVFISPNRLITQVVSAAGAGTTGLVVEFWLTEICGTLSQDVDVGPGSRRLLQTAGVIGTRADYINDGQPLETIAQMILALFINPDSALNRAPILSTNDATYGVQVVDPFARPTPSPVDGGAKPSSNSNALLGPIIGGVAGGIVLILLGLFCWSYQKKKAFSTTRGSLNL